MQMTNALAAESIPVATRLFRSLGDPTRMKILLALGGGEQRVSDIVDVVGTSQSNISGHLACLRECGLVVDRPDARRQVFYRIAEPELHKLFGATSRLVDAIGDRIGACENRRMP